MKSGMCLGVTTLSATVMFAEGLLADTPVQQTRNQKQDVYEETVFVTGSLIPQRIKLRRIGTTTVSPIRVIDRRAIDETGRHTTPGVLIDDPSVRIIGH